MTNEVEEKKAESVTEPLKKAMDESGLLLKVEQIGVINDLVAQTELDKTEPMLKDINSN